MFSGKFISILLSGLLTAGFLAGAAELLQESYVAPGGSGKRTGADAANAFASISEAWLATAPGGTVYVQPGNYKNQSLIITAETGGQPDKIKKIRGVKGEDSYPRFSADWDRTTPARGRDFIRLRKGASHIEISGLTVEDYREGVFAEGGNDGLAFRGLSFTRIRDGIYLNGGDKILIEQCRMEGFTKRGVRLQGGITNAVVRDTLADAGGKEFATEKFQMCFSAGSVKDTVDSDILFENCTAANAYDDAGKKYWNADGFCAEGNTERITWKNCRAFNCTDGGWDIKTRDAVLIDCVAFGNKRNFRFWNKAVMTNCIAGFALKRGGSGTEAGVHVCGKNGHATVIGCTLIGNRIAVDADQQGVAVLESCLIAPMAEDAEHSTSEPEAKVQGLDKCRILTPIQSKEAFPASSDWNGIGTEFDSPDGGIGYRSK